MPSVISLIQGLIGMAPTGYEVLEYVFAGIIALYFVQVFVDIFRLIGTAFTGRR